MIVLLLAGCSKQSSLLDFSLLGDAAAPAPSVDSLSPDLDEIGPPAEPPDLALGPTHPVFIAVGDHSRYAVSRDGTTWPSDAFSGTLGIFRVALVGNGVALLAGAGMLRSTDGVTFTQQSPPVGISEEGCGLFVHGKFYFVDGGNALITTDGLTWQSSTGGKSVGHCNSLVYGNGYFMAYGDNGAHKRSVDGLQWTDFQSTGTNFSSVAYINGMFVAVGPTPSAMSAMGGGHMATSADGLTWSNDAYVHTGSGNLSGIAYGNGVYSTSDLSYCWWSTDAKIWTHTGNGYHGGHVVFVDNQFVGVGAVDAYHSTDGKQYTSTLKDADAGARAYFENIGGGYLN